MIIKWKIIKNHHVLVKKRRRRKNYSIVFVDVRYKCVLCADDGTHQDLITLNLWKYYALVLNFQRLKAMFALLVSTKDVYFGSPLPSPVSHIECSNSKSYHICALSSFAELVRPSFTWKCIFVFCLTFNSNGKHSLQIKLMVFHLLPFLVRILIQFNRNLCRLKDKTCADGRTYARTHAHVTFVRNPFRIPVKLVLFSLYLSFSNFFSNFY